MTGPCANLAGMTYRFAAFVRGINVGRTRKIEMAALRAILGDLGLEDVRTHLQSGNAVFGCPTTGRSALATRIEDSIESHFGFRPAVILRNIQEIRKAIADDPLASMASDPSRHLIGFLREAPQAGAAEVAEGKSVGKDTVRVAGSHLYMWCPNGVSRSPLFKVDFDRVLGTPLTMRNLNTVNKVAELLES